MNQKVNSQIVISWFVVVIWMSLIFYLSHQPASESSELSSGVVEVILSFLKVIPFVNNVDLEILHFIVRKLAHFFAYFMLGVFVIHALKNTSELTYRLFFSALGICIAYAISDEIHQLFIVGRSGEVRDVGIDSLGAFVGIVVYLLVQKTYRELRKSPS